MVWIQSKGGNCTESHHHFPSPGFPHPSSSLCHYLQLTSGISVTAAHGAYASTNDNKTGKMVMALFGIWCRCTQCLCEYMQPPPATPSKQLVPYVGTNRFLAISSWNIWFATTLCTVLKATSQKRPQSSQRALTAGQLWGDLGTALQLWGDLAKKMHVELSRHCFVTWQTTTEAWGQKDARNQGLKHGYETSQMMPPHWTKPTRIARPNTLPLPSAPKGQSIAITPQQPWAPTQC